MDSTTRRLIEHAPLVIVDFDGTLATLRTDWAGLKARLASTCRLRGWTWTPGGRLDQNLRGVRSEHGEGAFLELCDLVTEAELTGFRPDEVAHDLIDLLRDRAPDPVAIVTNNTKSSVSRILREPAFLGLRARVIGKEDVYESKPSPQGLIRACRLFVASPRATVFLGDSDVDELAADAAGIGIFLRVTPPGRRTLRLAA